MLTGALTGALTRVPVVTSDDAFTARLAQVLRAARQDRGLTTAALAQASGVSRGSVVKLERGDSQPSAALLGRLCGPLGLTLSELFARVETRTATGRLVRAASVQVGADPVSGHRRRSLSPSPEGPVQLTEIVLPPGAAVTYPARSYADLHQQVWVLEGELEVREGTEPHHLHPGDCLELGVPADCTFTNPGGVPARYLVVVARRR